MVLAYTVHCVEKACRKSLRTTLTMLYIISLIFIFGEMILPIEYVDSEYGSYSLGPKAYCLYGNVIFFFLMSVYLLVRYYNQLKNEHRGALYTAIFVIATMSAVQIFFPFILLTSLGMTIIILNFMLTLEDSQLYMLPNNTLYNETACNELLKELLVYGRGFKLGIYSFGGDSERISLAMCEVQKSLKDNGWKTVCCSFGDNLLVVVPMRKFLYGYHDLPDELPKLTPLNNNYSYTFEMMEFGDEQSLAGIIKRIFYVRRKFNERINQQDQLTETDGRTFFTQYIEQMISETQDFSFLMMDLDNFKQINDTYGHQIGDEVLKNTAVCLRSILRSTDCLCRIGGDEFAVILLGITKPDLIIDIANRIRKNLTMVRLSDGTTISVSFSIGVHISDETERGESFHNIYAEADRALYRAKNCGRNCVVFARDY